MRDPIKFRPRIIEMAAAIFLLVIAAVFLVRHGQANRLRLPSQKVEQIAQPHEAFREWEKYGVHGRILVLMDRQLNAEEDENTAFEFTPDEFTGSPSIAALCKAIDNDNYGIGQITSTCTIDGLNAFLRTQDFYPAWLRTKKDIVIPPEIMEKKRQMRGVSVRFEELPDEWQRNITEFNRRLLELTYPGVTPRKSAWSFVGSNNYVYKAIQGGYLRKIYHVLPESAWPEVEKTLRQYQLVTASAGTFRMAIESFTPVVILRLRDLPSFPEEVLMNINSAYWSDDELKILAGMIQHDRIKSDLITVSGPASEKMIDLLRSGR